MRPLRLFLSLLFSLVFVTFLLYLSITTDPDQYVDPDHPGQARHRLQSYFFFHNPALLFTPAATISLTDDNSTFFAARPAAFGPQLPSSGISGQLWVGSGFRDDNLDRRGLLAGVEGELGCSDIPGWDNHNWRLADDRSRSLEQEEELKMDVDDPPLPRNAQIQGNSALNNSKHFELNAPGRDDGTDDYLHFPLASTNIVPHSRGNSKHGLGSSMEHADIKSLQESAEIAGKIVILSRGGCGFSEKVKWAQRRGATAVIIGDNVLGGALVRMYATGDAVNITIPSLFTSHMSAHLLSSLMPTGRTSPSTGLWSWVDDPTRETSRNNNGLNNVLSDADPTTVSAGSQAAYHPKSSNQVSSLHKAATGIDGEAITAGTDSSKTGWIKSSLSSVGLRKESHPEERDKYTRRPPSSGLLRWSEDDPEIDQGTDDQRGTGAPRKAVGDFIIGIQDWRDPDVIREIDSPAEVTYSSTSAIAFASTLPKSFKNVLKGGSITPGSGEYEKPENDFQSFRDHPLDAQPSESSSRGSRTGTKTDAESWASLLAGYEETEDVSHFEKPKSDIRSTDGKPVAIARSGTTKSAKDLVRVPLLNQDAGHTGLWVTLMPTDMSASPFFNTLFVLVISPLITLAIVYSMLLIRSRIRRRRWRAPKSVVERLPVHVYHRLSRSGSSSLPETTTVTSTTAATPLLSASRPTDIAARPRAYTTDTAPASSPSSSRYGSIESSSADQEKEKANAGLAEWRRKYKGKQMECVVCLEEYVDGISRVMSLPCGHEFHVDCITPWLTTRRRTCPICKGDVVRSMGRLPSSGRNAAANDMTEDQIQEQAAGTANNAPSSAMAIPHQDFDSEIDLEQARNALSPDVPETSWISRRLGRGLGYLGRQPHQTRPHSSSSNPS